MVKELGKALEKGLVIQVRFQKDLKKEIRCLSQREKKESEKWRGSREGTSRLVTYTYYGPDIKNFKTCKRIIIDFVVDRE